MKYFIFTSGLRGCYMPDTCDCYAFETRRALKSFLIERTGRDDGEGVYAGLSIRNITWMAAHAWKGKRGSDAILPYGFKGQGKPYCYELSATTRKDYLERLKQEDA